MISLTTLLASATVAAAAKKVEDVPAPGIVDTILGFVPSWLGGPVAQVFVARSVIIDRRVNSISPLEHPTQDKGIETLGVVLGWITAGPQVVADVVACVEINATRDTHRYAVDAGDHVGRRHGHVLTGDG